jgi:hypothetical protein
MIELELVLINRCDALERHRDSYDCGRGQSMADILHIKRSYIHHTLCAELVEFWSLGSRQRHEIRLIIHETLVCYRVHADHGVMMERVLLLIAPLWLKLQHHNVTDPSVTLPGHVDRGYETPITSR